jgi:hypothetical protein
LEEEEIEQGPEEKHGCHCGLEEVLEEFHHGWIITEVDGFCKDFRIT